MKCTITSSFYPSLIKKFEVVSLLGLSDLTSQSHISSQHRNFQTRIYIHTLPSFKIVQMLHSFSVTVGRTIVSKSYQTTAISQHNTSALHPPQETRITWVFINLLLPNDSPVTYITGCINRIYGSQNAPDYNTFLRRKRIAPHFQNVSPL